MSRNTTWKTQADRLNAEIRAERAEAVCTKDARDRRIAAQRAAQAARIARIQAGGPPTARLAVTTAFSQHPRTMAEVLARAEARRTTSSLPRPLSPGVSPVAPAAGAASSEPCP